MPRDLPIDFSATQESALRSSKTVSSAPTPRHLSVIAGATAAVDGRLTRGHVANRLGISVSTVRRFEGTRLHPTIDGDGVRWFDGKEVASLAAELANAATTKRKGRAEPTTDTPRAHSAGEVAALVFERLEQRQSLAEIVVGVRVTPELARSLFDQWCLGLTEGQLRLQRESNGPRVGDLERVRPDRLAALLAGLPHSATTRISVARMREPTMIGDHDHICVSELGGFLVAGPCDATEVLRRFGSGTYRISAYAFDPSGIRWEVIVDGLGHV